MLARLNADKVGYVAVASPAIQSHIEPWGFQPFAKVDSYTIYRMPAAALSQKPGVSRALARTSAEVVIPQVMRLAPEVCGTSPSVQLPGGRGQYLDLDPLEVRHLRQQFAVSPQDERSVHARSGIHFRQQFLSHAIRDEHGVETEPLYPDQTIAFFLPRPSRMPADSRPSRSRNGRSGGF